MSDLDKAVWKTAGKINDNTFVSSSLLLASTGITQRGLLSHTFYVDDLCVLYMFIYFFNNLLFFAAVCKTDYKLIFGIINISFVARHAN